jgi:hypothetical protein
VHPDGDTSAAASALTPCPAGLILGQDQKKGFEAMFHALLFISMALVFALLKVVLEKRLAPMDAGGEARQLSDLAYDKGCSVYDLFREAGDKWGFSKAKIESDFRQYLHQDFVPTYLHDYLRENSAASAHTYQKVIFAGGRPPYL